MASGFPPTPAYPKGYDSDSTLFLVYNTSESVTTADNAPWSEEIVIVPVDSEKDEIWPENGFANIEGELFYYDSVDKNADGKIYRFKRCLRNLGGTKTKYNHAGAEVRGFVMAEHHNQLVTAILKMEDFIGENFTEERATLDWRIRNLAAVDPISDDHSCPDLTFEFTPLSTDPATGTLARYNITINGSFTSYRLDFGDGDFTTSTTSGTHLYPTNSIIDPVVTVANAKCTLVQSPIERTTPTEPPVVEPVEVFEVTIPTIPNIPPIIIPDFDPPSNAFNIPPIVFPCLDLNVDGSNVFGVPSVIVIDPPLNVPSVITISGPTIPPTISITPVSIPSVIDIPTLIAITAVDIPTLIEIAPLSISGISITGLVIPTLIEFGPVFIPTFIAFEPVYIPSQIVLSPVYVPSEIVLSPVYIPSEIVFGAAPYIPSEIVFGPAPYIPPTIEFGPAPYIPTLINFGPAPYIPTLINFGPAPYIPTLIEFGPAPYIATLVNFGPAPYIPTLVNFGPAPYIPSQIVFGPAPYIPSQIAFGPAPSLIVYWDTPPSLVCTVNVVCPAAAFTSSSAPIPNDDFQDSFEPVIDSTDLGIPSEIKITVPEIPDIKVLHSIPEEIRVLAPEIPDIKLIGWEKIPRRIKLTPSEDLPKSITLDATDVPKSITLDAASVPTVIRLERGETLPTVITVDGSSIPSTIQVVGIPPTIELIGNIPTEISVKMPDKMPEMELVYKGAPIEFKIQLDTSKLTGESETAQCVAIVPCTPK